MNASVYIFGEFNGGYTQYPDDYTASIFQKFAANAKSTTQIAIHRNGDLIYYGYIRKLEQNKYIGLCIVLNGKMFNPNGALFSLFENALSNIVSKGMLINFDEQGNLVTSVEKLYLRKEEIELIKESLRVGASRLESDCMRLPAVSYGTSKDSTNVFLVDDNPEDITKSSYTNGYTYIYKSKGYNTAQLNSYKGVLRKSYAEKKKLQDQLDTLRKENEKIRKEKKQFKWVLVLFLFLLVCSTFLLIQTDKLSNASNTISVQNDSLNVKTTQISNLNDEKNELDVQRQAEEDKRIVIENEFKDFKKKITDRQPFIVKATSFNFDTGYLTFEYYGMVHDSVNIQVKAFNDNGESHSKDTTIEICKGDNTTSIYLSKSLDSSKWYSFEILKGNVILGGDRH